MPWEAVTAISTAFTSLVILATVLYAARQVKAANEQSSAMASQLEHLRRATQLEGALAIFHELMSPQIQDAYRFVLTEFRDRMKDERFHAGALERAPDPSEHKEVTILRNLERVGTLAKNGLIDTDILLDFSSLFIRENWSILGPLAAEQRALLGESELWENFEFVALAAERARRDH